MKKNESPEGEFPLNQPQEGFSIVEDDATSKDTHISYNYQPTCIR